MAKQSIAKDVMFFWTPLRILAFSSAVASPIPSMRNISIFILIATRAGWKI